MTAQQQTLEETPYYHADLDGRDPLMYWRTHSITQSPVRKAGEATGIVDYLDPTEKPRRAWSYTPGQRRVRRAPNVSYDNPGTASDGLRTTDNFDMFSGAPDRYDNTTRHDHLICTRCGALADFKFTDLTHDVEAALGARIQSYDLRIHYLCPACRKAQEEH